jgi:UDP-N-acetylmuramate dehydrogenase
MDFKTGVKLSDFSNYRTGGEADYFIEAKSEDDIKLALNFAKEKGIKFFILGKGTNVLFPDDGFSGIVIKIGIDDFKIEGNSIIAGAGVLVSDLVKASIDRELTGFDWAGGLPGTVGGGVRGNAGCFGGEMKDSVLEITAVDINGEKKEFSNRECNFDYRYSIFKKEKFIITKVVFSLRKELSKENLSEVVKDHINYRNEHQPLDYPNCGSVFKNVPTQNAPEWVREKIKGVIKKDPFPVIPTAALIHEAGLKGHVIGGAQVSEKHPNFIINFNKAKSKDIVDLIFFVKK